MEEGAPSEELLFPLPSLIKSAVGLVLISGATSSQGAEAPGCHYLIGQSHPVLGHFHINLYIKQNFFYLTFFFLFKEGSCVVVKNRA